MTVQPEDYMDKLVEYGIMKIFAICAVDETHQAWCEEDDFQVDKPPMNIEVCNKTNVYIFLEYVLFTFFSTVSTRKPVFSCSEN